MEDASCFCILSGQHLSDSWTVHTGRCPAPLATIICYPADVFSACVRARLYVFHATNCFFMFCCFERIKSVPVVMWSRSCPVDVVVIMILAGCIGAYCEAECEGWELRASRLHLPRISSFEYTGTLSAWLSCCWSSSGLLAVCFCCQFVSFFFSTPAGFCVFQLLTVVSYLCLTGRSYLGLPAWLGQHQQSQWPAHGSADVQIRYTVIRKLIGFYSPW